MGDKEIKSGGGEEARNNNLRRANSYETWSRLWKDRKNGGSLGWGNTQIGLLLFVEFALLQSFNNEELKQSPFPSFCF